MKTTKRSLCYKGYGYFCQLILMFSHFKQAHYRKTLWGTMVTCKQGTFLTLGVVGIIMGALTIGLYSFLYDAILRTVSAVPYRDNIDGFSALTCITWGF